MKTKLIFTLFVVLFLGMNLAKAETDTIPTGENRRFVQKLLTKEIGYPQFAIDEQITGTVYVSVSFNTDGSVKLNEIKGTDEKLSEYVSGKLKGIKLSDVSESPDFIYFLKFKFELY